MDNRLPIEPLQLDPHPLDDVEYNRADEGIVDAGDAVGPKVAVQMGIRAASPRPGAVLQLGWSPISKILSFHEPLIVLAARTAPVLQP
jgi:hypothetical protein